MPGRPELLQLRLIDFAAAVCREVRRASNDVVSVHLAKQMVRSGTSPAANYAEARGAESRRDFVHRMQVCLKELRETWVWLCILHRVGGGRAEIEASLGECDELIAIFVASVNTAKSRRPQSPIANRQSPIAESAIL